VFEHLILGHAGCTRTDPAPLPAPLTHEPAEGGRRAAPTPSTAFVTATPKPGIIYNNCLIFQITNVKKSVICFRMHHGGEDEATFVQRRSHRPRLW